MAKPIVDSDAGRVVYIPPGGEEPIAAPVTAGQLLDGLLRILERCQGPGDAVDAVFAVKAEVDKWEVSRRLPTVGVRVGEKHRGPDGRLWTWNGSSWVASR